MKILIVEDEPKTGTYLKQGLTEAGFITDLAVTGTDGQYLALTETFDLIILDVMLPGINGWDVLRALRVAGKSMPVLFLTARDQVDDRVKGLELGADDYLVKPFAFSELLARVRTLLRRGKPASTAILPNGLEAWKYEVGEGFGLRTYTLIFDQRGVVVDVLFNENGRHDGLSALQIQRQRKGADKPVDEKISEPWR